jgi:hypothetical protein
MPLLPARTRLNACPDASGVDVDGEIPVWYGQLFIFRHMELIPADWSIKPISKDQSSQPQ